MRNKSASGDMAAARIASRQHGVIAKAHRRVAAALRAELVDRG